MWAGELVGDGAAGADLGRVDVVERATGGSGRAGGAAVVAHAEDSKAICLKI